jgi:biopolymer transport protein ExbD
MTFRKHASQRDYITRLPLVAFIDVTFFLLLYFVMAGTLAEGEADLTSAVSSTPRGSGRGNDFSSQIVYVENDAGRTRFRVADKVLPTQADVVALLRRLPKDPGVIIKAADDVTVAAAAAALQAAKDAGFRKVTYVGSK